MLKVYAIEAFGSVAEAGSITGAARSLAVLKSLVSEPLAYLERSLDANLPQRTMHKLSLTEEGDAFYARVPPLTSIVLDRLLLSAR